MLELNGTRSPWRKSRSSGLNGCIEVTTYKGQIFVRDSEDFTENCFSLTNKQWIHFIERVKCGGLNAYRR